MFVTPIAGSVVVWQPVPRLARLPPLVIVVPCWREAVTALILRGGGVAAIIVAATVTMVFLIVFTALIAAAPVMTSLIVVGPSTTFEIIPWFPVGGLTPSHCCAFLWLKPLFSVYHHVGESSRVASKGFEDVSGQVIVLQDPIVSENSAITLAGERDVPAPKSPVIMPEVCSTVACRLGILGDALPLSMVSAIIHGCKSLEPPWLDPEMELASRAGKPPEYDPAGGA